MQDFHRGSPRRSRLSHRNSPLRRNLRTGGLGLTGGDRFTTGGRYGVVRDFLTTGTSTAFACATSQISTATSRTPVHSSRFFMAR